MSVWEPVVISIGLFLDIIGAIIILVLDSEILEKYVTKYANLFALFSNWPVIGYHSEILANLEDIDHGIRELLYEDPLNQHRDTHHFHRLKEGEPGFYGIKLILARKLDDVPDFDVINLDHRSEVETAKGDVRSYELVVLGIHDTDLPRNLGVEIPPDLLREWVEKHKRNSVVAIGGLLLVIGFSLQLIPHLIGLLPVSLTVE